MSRHTSRQDPHHAADQALFREALRQWLDWYHGFHCDGGRRDDGGIAGTVYDAARRGLCRSEGEHADHVLGRLLAEERRHHDWPASIHAIVMDMPRDWRICLYGTAMEYSQARIGRELGLRQQLVSAMLASARRTLLLRLKLLARTQRVLRQMG